MGEDRSLEARVAALESEVRQLRAELLRREGREPFVAEPVMAPVEARALPAFRPDLETLVGRYGMLGLATLLALAAIGTFVSWAAARGLFGPTTRVILGFVAAIGIAGAGLMLRPRSRSFSDSLLALALSAIHVCSWAAGPSLGLVPAPLALAFSAAASVALGAFALVEADELLWCVGFGGACVAPFVTSTGQGTAPMLAAYAAAVLVTAGSALASRRWFVAGRIFAAGATLFVAVLLVLPAAQNAALLALGLPFVVAGFGVLPFARGDLLRPRLRTMGLLAGAAAIVLGYRPLHWMGPAGAALAIGIAGCAWLVLLELTDGEPAGRLIDGLGDLEEAPGQWVDGALVPALFLCALSLALGSDVAVSSGVAAAVLLASASRRSGMLRDALAASTWAAATLATLLATRTSPAACIAAVAWTSVSLVWVGVLRVPSRSWTWTSRLSLAFTSLWALASLSAQPRYAAFPFSTAASGASLAIGLGWAALLFAARKESDDAAAASARIGLGAFGFVWGHQELAHAISPSASALLLMGYYAVGSVAFVGWGRAQGSATLRRLGLALGLVAALLAVRGAWHLPGAGTRIAAYLLVSGFLLGIAWWYRQPDDRPATEVAS